MSRIVRIALALAAVLAFAAANGNEIIWPR